MRAKKHLSSTALRKMVSHQINSWPDPRRQDSVDHSVHDAVMSGLACMYFQEPSLLQFQREMEARTHQNNLRTLFGVQHIPSSNTIKDILDDKDSRLFNPLFKEVVGRLQRGKQLAQFNLVPGWTVCSMDGTAYHSSHCIHCKQCLTKQHGDNPVIYQHFAHGPSGRRVFALTKNRWTFAAHHTSLSWVNLTQPARGAHESKKTSEFHRIEKNGIPPNQFMARSPPSG